MKLLTSIIAGALLALAQAHHVTAGEVAVFSPSGCTCTGKLCTCKMVPDVVFSTEQIEALRNARTPSKNEIEQYKATKVPGAGNSPE
jgi:hypothetical protein